MFKSISSTVFMVLVAVLVLAAGTSVTASPILVVAEADSHVQGGASAPTNFGSGLLNEIKGGGAVASRRKFYIQFSTNDIIGDATAVSLSLNVERIGGDIAHTLRIYGLIDGYAGGNNFNGAANGGETVNDLGESWGELALTCENAPGEDGSSFSMAASAMHGGTFLQTLEVVSSSTLITFDATSLASFINADTNGVVTFIITDETLEAQSSRFYSRQYTPGDNTDAPRLSVTTIVPEPASMGLLTAGALMVLARRGR